MTTQLRKAKQPDGSYILTEVGGTNLYRIDGVKYTVRKVDQGAYTKWKIYLDSKLHTSRPTLKDAIDLVSKLVSNTREFNSLGIETDKLAKLRDNARAKLRGTIELRECDPVLHIHERLEVVLENSKNVCGTALNVASEVDLLLRNHQIHPKAAIGLINVAWSLLWSEVREGCY